jgi:GH15 family glucan-1,4-alpha-glucosidase
MTARIEDYALIGDCETAALVSRDGSIDWLCWPRFDSDACFAALLGTSENGRWKLTASDPKSKVTRRYIPNTLILETEYITGDGSVQVLDFMPLRTRDSDIVRIVVGKTGQVSMCSELKLRFGYGSVVPWVTRASDGGIMAISGPDKVTLRSPIKTTGKGLSTVAEFTVSAGQTMAFSLSHTASHLDAADAIDVQQALRETREYWEKWVAAGQISGPYGEAVTRSLITLKALTYSPTGGIVAAPTTSLPEKIGGARNWDYRFCWLRDATLSLLSFMNAGYYDEARAWRDWLMRAAAGSPAQIRIMYGLAGERRLTEWELDWLDGYADSRPVRVGNAAATQRQLDVFGEVMDVLHQARRGGIQYMAEGWDFQRAMLDHLETVWREPDEGIWETRGPSQHFTFSKVMAWVAFDRGIKGIEEFDLPGPADKWRRIRAEIHEQVCTNAFNPAIGAFAQAYGSDLLDASILLLPTVGFISPHDHRIKSTIAAIEKTLLRDGFVMRYDTHETEDGLPPGEGAFLACSFWLADAYAQAGRTDDARKLFESLLTLRNDVGLLAEEYDPTLKIQVGNFPQAFSHVALIDTAYNLTRTEKPSEQRSDRQSATA